MSAEINKIFITAESLLRDSMTLGVQILRQGFRPTYLVAIWRGGAPIGITVQEVFEYHGLRTDHISIRTSSYTGIDTQVKTVRVHAVDYLVSRLTYEDRLLLIDDVFDSGRSLEAVLHELQRHGLLQAGAQPQLTHAGLLRQGHQRVAGFSARDSGPDARGDPGAQAGRGELLRDLAGSSHGLAAPLPSGLVAP
jgi:hypoxanthine-guanine phosphoribosyltransferase